MTTIRRIFTDRPGSVPKIRSNDVVNIITPIYSQYPFVEATPKK